MKKLALLLPLLLAFPLAARAEKVDMTPGQLRDAATHVVTGNVVGIYERKSREGDWFYTRFVAEVAVDGVEKGEGLAKGGLVYVRYWRRRYAGREMPPSTTGHRGLPAEGDRMRIYLARNAYDGFGETKDGGFNVFGANGFAKLEAAAE